ncbi:hypothetical protein EVAR_55023_1 [Eumeta japonica]|uniref:Uncharacterized protein n=1 Tax=Eumeta variegata TaxID=151549 RepID=A0A4C1YFN5_EUMVA|nr:hypothetical protein EVAR_55023_1 [Eumeta japonica]
MFGFIEIRTTELRLVAESELISRRGVERSRRVKPVLKLRTSTESRPRENRDQKQKLASPLRGRAVDGRSDVVKNVVTADVRFSRRRNTTHVHHFVSRAEFNDNRDAKGRKNAMLLSSWQYLRPFCFVTFRRAEPRAVIDAPGLMKIYRYYSDPRKESPMQRNATISQLLKNTWSFHTFTYFIAYTIFEN